MQIYREEERGILSTFSKQFFDFSSELDFGAVDVAYAVDIGGGSRDSTI